MYAQFGLKAIKLVSGYGVGGNILIANDAFFM